MVGPTIYCLYLANSYTNTACRKRFVQLESETLPIALNHSCNWCKTTHSFRLERRLQAGTQRQKDMIKQWCDYQGVDWDVAD